jgi:hypothetical protein
MEEGGMRQGTILTVAALALLIAALPIFATPVAAVVVPNAQSAVDGNIGHSFPFNCGGVVASMRYQQVYLASEVGSLTIGRIAFRQEPGASAFGPTTIFGVTITLSSTSNGPDALDATFANNVGADETTVFSGNLTLSSAGNTAVSPNPAPFDIVIALQNPFAFNASGGKNLLLDVTIPTCVTLHSFDAQLTGGDSVSRVEKGPVDSTGNLSTIGLVTQFDTPASIPTLSEWATIAMVLILAGLAVWRLRRPRATA